MFVNNTDPRCSIMYSIKLRKDKQYHVSTTATKEVMELLSGDTQRYSANVSSNKKYTKYNVFSNV